MIRAVPMQAELYMKHLCHRPSILYNFFSTVFYCLSRRAVHCVVSVWCMASTCPIVFSEQEIHFKGLCNLMQRMCHDLKAVA